MAMFCVDWDKKIIIIIIIRVVWLLWASDVWACRDQQKYFLADPRRLQTNFFFLGEFESWLKTYHAIGPGESFWFLVDTRAAQILPIVLGMALACDKSGLVGECFFYEFYPDDPLLYLLALWGGPRSNQPLVFVNNIVMQIWIFLLMCQGSPILPPFQLGERVTDRPLRSHISELKKLLSIFFNDQMLLCPIFFDDRKLLDFLFAYKFRRRFHPEQILPPGSDQI